MNDKREARAEGGRRFQREGGDKVVPCTLLSDNPAVRLDRRDLTVDHLILANIMSINQSSLRLFEKNPF